MFKDIKLLSDKTRQPNLAHFLMGHSKYYYWLGMGGALALKYCMEHDDIFAGVLSSAPCTAPGKDTDISTIEKIGARILGNLLPSFSVYNPINISTLTRDQNDLLK